MSAIRRFVGILSLFLSLDITAGDDACMDGGPGAPGCSTPFPPGHLEMGTSYWAIGDEKFGAIMETVTTFLTVPQVSAGSPGIMAINPAMENTNRSDTEDRIDARTIYQTMVVAYPNKTCDQALDQWCMFPSCYDAWSDPQQYSGPAAPVSAGDSVNITYEFLPEFSGESGIAQYATVNGRTSTITNRTMGGLVQWWPRTECQCESKGVIPEHTYSHTQITLDKPVPDLDSSISHNGGNFSKPYTSNGGRTWHIDQITIAQTSCNSNESCTAPM